MLVGLRNDCRTGDVTPPAACAQSAGPEERDDPLGRPPHRGARSGVGLDPKPAPYRDFRAWMSALPQAGCRIGNPSDSAILVARTLKNLSVG